MDNICPQLKTLNTQMDFFTKQKIATGNNLISLLDMTYPDVNFLFTRPTRDDSSEKQVDFAASFGISTVSAKLTQKLLPRVTEPSAEEQ